VSTTVEPEAATELTDLDVPPTVTAKSDVVAVVLESVSPYVRVI